MARFLAIDTKTDQVDPNFSQIHLFEFDEIRSRMSESTRILIDYSSFTNQPESEIKYSLQQWEPGDQNDFKDQDQEDQDQEDENEGDEGDEEEDEEEEEDDDDQESDTDEKQNYNSFRRCEIQGPLSD